MSLEDVIKSGEGLSEAINYKMDVISFLTTLFLFSALVWVLSGLLIWFAMEGKDTRLATWCMVVFSLSLLSMSFSGYSSDSLSEESKNKEIDREEQLIKWKETIAYPYIRQQEQVAQPLQKIVLESHEVEPGQLSLTLAYSDALNSNKITSETGVYEINNTLQEDAQPYLSYHLLTDDLGNGITKGRYFKVVHLPKDYKFGD